MANIYLITGIAGFIGSHIAEKLLKRGESVIGIDNFYSGKVENIEFLEKLNGSFKFFEIDLRDIDKLRDLFKNEKPTNIFHLGAVASVQKSIEDPIFTNSVNVTGTLNILQLSKEFGVKRVVFSSSAAVYGDEPTLPKSENSIISPISPYGYEKLMGEHYMSLYNSLYGVETVSLRYFNVYGERQDPSSDYSGVISIFEDRVKKSLPINIYGDGKQNRDFIYVGDVADINILAMESNRTLGQIFTVGTGVITTINELFQIIKKKYSSNLEPNYLPSRNGDIRESKADNSRVKELLEFNSFTLFENGIKRL